MIFCWKSFDHPPNNCEGLTQWDFVPIGKNLPTQLQTWITWGTALKPINVLMTTGAIKNNSPYPWPSKTLGGEQIHMSRLDTAHWQFSITPEDKLQYQWTLIQYIWYTQVNNQQKKARMNNLKGILDQANLNFKEKYLMNK